MNHKGHKGHKGKTRRIKFFQFLGVITPGQLRNAAKSRLIASGCSVRELQGFTGNMRGVCSDGPNIYHRLREDPELLPLMMDGAYGLIDPRLPQ